MTPLTRRQSNMQATTSRDQEDEHPQDAVATSNFWKLPSELRKTVAEYLTRSSDMKSVCLVSKEMHALILPYLYQHVTLSLAKLDFALTMQRFHADNPGLLHIRTLQVLDDPFRSSDHKYLKSLCKLLTVIPKNTLRMFHLSTFKSIPQDLALLLRLRQQRLTNYQYHTLQPNIMRIGPAFDEVSHVTSLQLFLKFEQDCEIAGQLFGLMPLVTDVAVKLSGPCLVHSTSDQAETGRKVLDMIFGSTTNTSHGRAKVKQLRIEAMSFESAGDTLTAVLPLENLEQLHLFNCADTGRLIEHLTPLKMRLKSFCNQIAHYGSRPTIDDFLKALPPLQRLRLSDGCRTGEYEICDWQSLLHHAQNLRCLEMDDYKPGPEDSVFMNTKRSLAGFRTFCHHATQLQQLSMKSPQLEKYHWHDPCGLQAVLHCLRQLRHLKLLKLLYYPINLALALREENDVDGDVSVSGTFNGLRPDRECDRAEAVAKAAVDHIFDSLAQSCPFFVALHIEVRDPFGGALGHHSYLRAKQTDLLGKTMYVALPIKYGTIKFWEPCSEIVEWHDDRGELRV